jgi:DNA primase
MQPLEFLAAVLPSSGVYCAAEFTTPKKEHVFTDNLQGILDAGQKFVDTNRDAYFALSTFKEVGSRTADNARLVKALYMDLDLGGEKAYANKKEAVAAFEEFMSSTGMVELGQPFVVSSGGGFHVYWPLDEEVEIAQWKPMAENFKRLCRQENLIIDWNCTADAARVLRIPGTF